MSIEPDRSPLRPFFRIRPCPIANEPEAQRIEFHVGNQTFRFGPEYLENREHAEWFVSMAIIAMHNAFEAISTGDQARDATRYRFIREQMTRAYPITYYSMPHALMFLRGVRGPNAFDQEVDARMNGAAFESRGALRND